MTFSNLRNLRSSRRLSRALFRAAMLFAIIGGFAIPRNALAHRDKEKKVSYEVIKSVDEAGKKVMVGAENNKNHTEKAIVVTAFTEITVDGQKAALHDLKPGMSVQVTLESDNEATLLAATHTNKN